MKRIKLITKQLEKRFAQLGRQDVDDPIVVTKLFHPFGQWRHYMIAYEPEDRMYFGWADGPEPELGYYSLDELEGVLVKGLPMERDLHFSECPLSEVKAHS